MQFFISQCVAQVLTPSAMVHISSDYTQNMVMQLLHIDTLRNRYNRCSVNVANFAPSSKYGESVLADKVLEMHLGLVLDKLFDRPCITTRIEACTAMHVPLTERLSLEHIEPLHWRLAVTNLDNPRVAHQLGEPHVGGHS